MSPHLTCDIFCRVIDNYGDIGVAWRLARQLADEYGVEVRLFVDDLASVGKIAPGVAAVDVVALEKRGLLDPSVVPAKAGTQFLQTSDLQTKLDPGLRRGDKVVRFVEASKNKVHKISQFPAIYAWGTSSILAPADLVIEAFACELPPAYLQKMATREQKLVWINLEYLSAEPWVAAHHLLPSPHPQLSLTKYFFFPGFAANTGGLIRERALTPAATASAPRQDALRLYVFGYDASAMPEKIGELAATDTVASVTLAEGALATRVADRVSEQGIAKTNVVNFVPQTQFDDLLADYNILFVRGEDSFVRAQYAAKPFIWQIYPQADDAHFIKLDAFLQRYCEGMPNACAAAVHELWMAWNGAPGKDFQALWRAFLQYLPALQQHAVIWRNLLYAQPDLASNLMTFCQKVIKI